MDHARKRQIWADLALLGITFIWGSTFGIVQDAVDHYPVLPFLAIRFGLAALVMLALFWRNLRGLSWRDVGLGCLIGAFLFAGYALQTTGLKSASVTKAGLITGLQTVSVPIITAIWLRRAPKPRIMLAALLAMVGIALMTITADIRIEGGDLFLLGCAISFGAHITAVGLLAPKTDALGLTVVQIAFVALASGLSSLAVGRFEMPIPGNVWGAAALTGILATALAFGVQNAVSKHTTPEHTGMVFAMEPVFAALYGYVILSERLGPRALFGGALVLLAMLIAEMRDPLSWAKGISLFLNPLFLAPLLLFWGATSGAPTVGQGLAWAALAIGVGVMVPLLFLGVALKTGLISDWDISRREERVQAPIIVMAILASATPLLVSWGLGGPRLLTAIFASALVLVAVSLAVTAFWKVSQHVLGIASLTTALVLIAGPAAAPSLLLIPVVAWARIVVRAHTLGQTVVGGIMGLAGPILVFAALGLI